jgi:hypothetical protein
MTSNTNRRLKKAITLAGVEHWDQLFQTLRRSCEIEWAMVAPQFIVSKWIGHSITVSGKHYTNQIPEGAFKLITEKAAHNPAQNWSEAPGSNRKQSHQQQPPIGDNCLQMPVDSSLFRRNGKGERGDSNPRPPGSQPGALTN